MKKHVERVSIKSCVLTLDNLIELSDLVRDGFPDGHGFSVSAEFNNTNIDMISINDFLAYNKLPDELENLEIRAWYPKIYSNIREIEMDVFVTFDNLGSWIHTSSKEETWVIGKNKQIFRFLDERSDKFQTVKDILRNSFFMSLVVGLWIAFMIRFISTLDFIYITIFSISSTYLIMGYINWAIFSLPRATKIIIRSKNLILFGMNVKELIALIISIISLIFSSIQLFR